MPFSREHYPANFLDMFVRNIFMKKVAHGVHENLLWFRPLNWITKFFWDDSQIKTELERMTRNATEPFRKSLGITMKATGANFCATPYWIPCGVSPLNFAVIAHFGFNLPWTGLTYNGKLAFARRFFL